MGAALSPDRADTGAATSVTTAAARPVINAPNSTAQPPALARVKHGKAKRAKPTASTTSTQTGDGTAAVSGTAAQQTPVQPSGGSGTGTSTKTQQTQKQSTDTSTVEPPPFDEHTTSGQ